MLQSTEQRAIAWTSIGLAAAVLLGWLVLFFGGEYLVGLIESGRGPLGHIKSLATRLLADVPNDQFAAALLGEFYKFAGRVTTIYVACQAFVLIASARNPHIVREFFSDKTHPLNLAIFRVVYFLTLFPRVKLHDVQNFSTTPKELWVAPPGLGWFIDILPQSETFVTVAYGFFAVACFAGLIGMCTRTACIMATCTAFYLLGVPQFFGKINHYHHIIWVGALLSVSRCSDVLSVDSIWRSLRSPTVPERPEPANVYSVPLRIVLLFLGLIYFFPGFWKYVVSGPEWFLSGNLQSRMLLRMFVSEGWTPVVRVDRYPLLCQIGGFTTIVVEIGFILLVFSRWGRYVAAIGGLSFHFLVRQLLNISFWPIQAYYLAFADIHGVMKWIGSRFSPDGVRLSYDPKDVLACRIASVSQVLDIFDLVDCKPAEFASTNKLRLRIDESEGWGAVWRLGRAAPLIWLVVPFLRATSNWSTTKPVQGHPSYGLRGVYAVGATVLLVNTLCGFTMTDSWPFGVYPTFARIIPPVFQSLTMDAVDENGRVLADVEIYYDPAIREVFPTNRLGEIVNRVSRAPDRSERLASIWNIWQAKHPEVAGANKVNFYIANYSCDPRDASRNPVERRLMEVVSLDSSVTDLP